jgi:precorrin-6A/cobalt-precorrin-6A reductase
MMAHRILILGGTTEARELAARLAQRADLAITLSLAGRTANPVAQPVPVRVGGFGGTEGLARYLAAERIHLLIDATHPFAARISANATAAAKASAVPLLTLRRPEWKPVAGDDWTFADTIPQAVIALGSEPRTVFVTLGRQELKPLEAAPQHCYVIRSVDPVEPRLAMPRAEYILDRGPFEEDRERALLERLGVEVVLSKNSGGSAAYAKLAAARSLGVPVILVRRPPVAGKAVENVDAAVDAVAHLLPPAA